MIKFGKNVFLVLDMQGDGAWYTPEQGQPHMVTGPAAMGTAGGVLTLDSKGEVRTVCGSRLKAADLLSGIKGWMCGDCSRFKDSEEYAVQVTRTRQMLAGLESEAESEESPALESPAADSDDEMTVNVVKIVSRGREVDAIAAATDGKCAYEKADGTLVLMHGRSKIAPVPGSESRDTTGAETGVCPVCRTEVRLTGSGYVPTHRPGNVQADGPVLSQRSVPVVDEGAPVADMAKVQNERAYETHDEDGNLIKPKDVEKARKEGKKLTVTPVVVEAPNAGAAVGSRDHGRSDGVAMTAGDLPPVQPQGKGYAAKAGTMALPVGRPRPDAQVINDVCVGGRYGYLTQEEYDALSRTRQRAYWRHVATNRERAARARKTSQNKAVATGERISPEARKAARKAARLGSSAEGTIARPVTRANGK